MVMVTMLVMLMWGSGVAHLLAVQTALVSLDGNELLAADGESIGKGVVGGGEGSC